MGKYYDALCKDVRFREGMHACMNCGVCTATCPAAEFYTFDPRQIMDTVQTKDDLKIEELLKSEQIWYCGECMSCRPRCPRTNTPAYVIQSLRTLSQRTGFFTESEKGRQQLVLKRVIGSNILSLGFCIHPSRIDPGQHPEQGPVWKWVHENAEDVFGRFGDGYQQEQPGAMRKIDAESIAEINRIFEVTGGMDFFDLIEEHSKRKAAEIGMTDSSGETARASDEYAAMTYVSNNGSHTL